MKMKKLLLAAALIVATITGSVAQTVISGNITTNTNLTNNNVYLLSGWVYVKAPATLTIQAGTIIKGEKTSQGTLIIERGAKLIAQGTAGQPIVFTSDQAPGARNYGDWGGIIVCGKASVNLPGGEGVIEGGTGATFGGGANPDDADNSGTLKYVRIEFPGIPFQPNQEINGLTMGGVGSATTIENIQISYSGDDSYEWFGGTVNAKRLIAFRGWDDDFDTDNGFKGKLQYGVSLRDPAIADQSGSNSFESDNDATGTAATPQTHPVFSNFSIFGPKVDAGTTINSNFKRGAHLRRNTATNIFNSMISGFPIGLLIDATTTETNATNGTLKFQNNVIAGCANPMDTIASSTWDIGAWFNTTGFNNTVLANNTDLMVADGYNLADPDFLPQTSSPLLNGASFADAQLQNSFFESTSFRGAFGAEDWTACWTNWDPQNTIYTSGLPDFNAIADFSITHDSLQITFTNASQNADSYAWDFGDAGNADTSSLQNPVYTFSADGYYTVTLIAYSACGNDTILQSIGAGALGVEQQSSNISGIDIYPNPFSNSAAISVTLNEKTTLNVSIFNIEGKLVANLFNGKATEGTHNLKFDAQQQTAGLYFARIVTNKSTRTMKLVVR
jgi:hypothetical protein